MTEMFLNILNMTLTASYVIMAVLIVRFLLKKAPKKYSYILWSAVGFRLLCPFSFSAVFSLFSMKPFDMTENAQKGGAVLEYIPENFVEMERPQISVGIPSVNTQINNAIATAPAEPPSAFSLKVLISVLAAVWLCGVIAMLVWGIISYIMIARKMRTAVLYKDNIYMSENVRSPFILGIFRPKIYVPFGLDEKSLAYVLAHEQTHLRRFDHIIKPLSFVLLSVHWFNPLCHAAFNLMSKDMEMSCDEKVLADFGVAKTAYSETLLSFATNRRFPSPSPLAFGETDVKQRIKNALRFKRPKVVISVVAVLVCVLTVVGCVANPWMEKEGDDGESEETGGEVTTGTDSVTGETENEVSVIVPTFPLPELELRYITTLPNLYEYYNYKCESQQDVDKYVDELIDSGFKYVSNDPNDSDLLINDDVMIWFFYRDGSFDENLKNTLGIYCIQNKPLNVIDAKSRDDFKKMVGLEDDIQFVAEVTSDTLYSKMGLQAFLTVSSEMRNQYRYVDYAMYFVGETVTAFEEWEYFNHFIVADIDKDGKDELLTYSNWGSGMVRAEITAYELVNGNLQKEYQNSFYDPFFYEIYTSEDGKVISAVDGVYYEFTIKDGQIVVDGPTALPEWLKNYYN